MRAASPPNVPARDHLKPRRRVSASAIREELRQRVLSGQWRPSQQIETEAALVEQFGACRATISKTLKELESEGLLVSQPGRGRYVTSHAGRKRTHTVAAIIPDLRQMAHPGLAHPMAGISDVVVQSTYHLQVLGLNTRQADATGANFWMGLVDTSRFDGAIVLAGHIPVERLMELAVQVPVVYVGSPSVPQRYAGVMVDFMLPAYQAAQQLLGLGHRRIALLTLHEDRRQGYDQLGGVRLALHEAINAGRVELELLHVEHNEPAHAQQAMQQRLAEGQPPTALICGSDDLAQGALECLQQAGLRVPQDMSVIGFGDFPLAPHLDVALNTFNTDWLELGRHGARQLMWMLEHPGQIPSTISITPTAVHRGSVAAPASASAR